MRCIFLSSVSFSKDASAATHTKLNLRHCVVHSEQYSRFSVCSGDNPLYGGLEGATT